MSNKEDQDNYRICSNCGSEMGHGYCIYGGEAYYCNELCLHESNTDEEIENMCIGEDNSDSYWTIWDE